MPGCSGAEALALLHKRKLDIPFIFVSGTLSEEMAVAAMRAGAHDYIVKDRSRRLVPAVERELRDAVARRELARDRDERDTAERRVRTSLAPAPDALVPPRAVLRHTLLQRTVSHRFPYCGKAMP